MSDPKTRRSGREAIHSGVAADASPIEHTMPVVPDVGVVSEPATTPVEATATMLPAAVPSMVEPSRMLAEDAWSRLNEAQLVLARGFEATTAQMTGMTHSGFAASADAAVALLGARTFADVAEINAALVRRGVDAAFESSAKLTEIGMKAMAEASRLLLWRAAAP
jgi:phasin protein